MQHHIEVDGRADAAAMGAAIEGCVHCGFCLPACPTYDLLGEEMDSPRGRIVLMKEVLEGGLGFDEARPYIDRCLGCLGCEVACPSGVRYRELLHPFRDLDRRHRPFPERLLRRLRHRVLAAPALLRWLLRLSRPFTRLAPLLPAALRTPLQLAATVPAARGDGRLVEVVENASARASLLLGCAQEALHPEITDAALRVLARFGVAVRVPDAQGCCGSLALHDGDLQLAREFARRNLMAFGDGDEPVVTTAAGCGSGMHEYELLFAGTPDEERAARLAGRTVDVTVLLAGLELPEFPPRDGALVRVAYQGACHLEAAQGVRREPRLLLAAVPGVELVELGDGDRCCGSAGTYNLEQPELAATLGSAKAKAVEASRADVVVSGNVGCLVQLRASLGAAGLSTPVLHTVQILDRAFRGRPLF